MSITLARSPAAAPIARRGLNAVEFVCPECGARRWGTTYGRGHCNACGFSWARALDWLHFRRLDGSRFLSGEAFAAFIGPEKPTVEHLGNLNDLLEWLP
jgi:hypothetical protein